jgi:hypothetical protein
MDTMEPKYLEIEKDGRKIFFRVHIEKRFAYSEFNADYFDYYVTISDEYEIDYGLFLAVDDYQNINIYNTVNKEYFGFEVDDLNVIYYFYEKLEFSGVTLEQVVKEILYQKFVGCGVHV